ncbi:MAG: transporter substrate-binding protein [Spirulinaceae cyanobacterium RM2_2_10]|nr:transporter substrate-binding protein [Spirulinaceae cyanobacterium RM2_2_10]
MASTSLSTPIQPLAALQHKQAEALLSDGLAATGGATSMSKPAMARVGIVYSGGALAADQAALLVEATQLAIAAINAAGGVLGRLLEPQIFDATTATRPEARQQIKTWLADERPAVLVGDRAAAEHPSLRVLQATGDPLLWCPLPALPDGGASTYLHTGVCPNQWVEPALTWLQQTGRTRLYYLAVDTPLGYALGDLLQAQVPAESWFGAAYLPATTSDFTPALQQAQATGAQVIVSAIAQPPHDFYTGSRQLGLDPATLPILALLPTGAAGQAPEAAGHYQLTHSYPNVSHYGHAAFAERFGATGDSTIEAAYTQLHLWAQAVELAGTFASDRVRTAALGLHGRAPSGLVQLEPNQFLSRPAYILHQTAASPPELVWYSRRPLKPLPWLGCQQPESVAELALARQEINETRCQNHQLEQRLYDLEARFAERTTALASANDQLIGEIVERQQAEVSLRGMKDQLEAILSAVPGIVSWISADLTYLGVNEELAGLFDLQPADFVGQDIGFLGTSVEFADFITQLFAGDRDDTTCEIANLIDGEMRTFLLVAQKYDAGRAAFIIGIDITARQQALDELARSKDQLQAVLDAVPGIVSWISADLRYMGANRQLAATFNLQPEDFVNQDIGFLQASQDFNQFVREIFSGPVADGFREVETLVDGELRNYLIAVQKYDRGRAAFTVGIDVTDRQRALDELARSKDQLQAILDAVPGIVSWISSDLCYLGVNRHLAATLARTRRFVRTGHRLSRCQRPVQSICP